MVLEWTLFCLSAFLLIAALICFTAAVIGAQRFGFMLNRMHAAGIGDSLGLFLVILSVLIQGGLGMGTLKPLLLIVFMWFSSPVSSHFLSQIEYYTNAHLYRYTERRLEEEEEEREGEKE